MDVNVSLMKQNIRQANCGVMINANGSLKNIKYVKKYIYICNPATCKYENGKYLASIMDDSVITFDKVIESYNEEIKTIPTDFNETKI